MKLWLVFDPETGWAAFKKKNRYAFRQTRVEVDEVFWERYVAVSREYNQMQHELGELARPTQGEGR